MTDANVVGRQPADARITPSKPYPWYGSIPNSEATKWGWRVGGDRFTVEQLAELGRRELDPNTVPAMMVRRSAMHREAYWGLGPRPVFEMECPILQQRTDGGFMVISPSGMGKMVEASGWISPSKLRSQGFRR